MTAITRPAIADRRDSPPARPRCRTAARWASPGRRAVHQPQDRASRPRRSGRRRARVTAGAQDGVSLERAPAPRPPRRPRRAATRSTGRRGSVASQRPPRAAARRTRRARSARPPRPPPPRRTRRVSRRRCEGRPGRRPRPPGCRLLVRALDVVHRERARDRVRHHQQHARHGHRHAELDDRLSPVRREQRAPPPRVRGRGQQQQRRAAGCARRCRRALRRGCPCSARPARPAPSTRACGRARDAPARARPPAPPRHRRP